MKKYALFCILLSIITSCFGQRNLLVLGDSLSAAYGMPQEEGWVALLQNHLQQYRPCYQVINRSITGETAVNAKRRLPELLKTYQPKWVILQLGGNDGLRGMPPGLIKRHLQNLIETAQEGGSKVLLVGIVMPPNYGERYATAFANNYTELSRSEDVPLIPFLLEGVADNRDLMQADRIHPTSKAQPIIFNTVWETLNPLLSPCGYR